MRGKACWALFFLLSYGIQSRAEVACVDRDSLAHSALGITRYFDDAERAKDPGFIGTSGTGWLLSPTTMITAAHVAAGMMLSAEDWKALEIQDGTETRSVSVRIQRLAGLQEEKLAVLELKEPMSGARSVAVRVAPLAPDDPVVVMAYPHRHQRLVGGRFVQYGEDDRFAGTALLEMYDGNDRLAIDYGASGAPVLDCEGHVAAVVSIVITQTLPLAGGTRVSTAWGTPNVLSLPIQILKDFSQAK
jgi:Trypsin-like peptidase domain